jgi:uncharacterized membrane protein YsdA (DUF1294 family)/cold shock CspA family protein
MDVPGVAKRTGTIIKFDADRGFGFISPASGTGDLFFHVRAVSGSRDGITVGEAVSFSIGLDKNGRFEAKRVWRSSSGNLGVSEFAALAFAGIFLMALSVAAAHWRVLWIPAIYAVLSALSFAAYAADKRKAQTGAWRTREWHLHRWDLCGGWPGGVVAQQLLRHKRRKTDFVTITLLIACLHILAWSWMFISERGKAILSLLN